MYLKRNIQLSWKTLKLVFRMMEDVSEGEDTEAPEDTETWVSE